MVHINFFPLPVVDIFTCRAGWGAFHALQSFCYLSFAGDSFLSSLCDSPPCLDMIRLSKSSQKLSAHACCPWGYPLQVPGAEEQDAENP